MIKYICNKIWTLNRENMKTVRAEGRLTVNTEWCYTARLKKRSGVELSLVAKDYYNLYVNGKFVAYGPARAAKGYARVERIALDEFLTEEENTVDVYVQRVGTRTLCFAEGETYFGCEITVDGKIELNTDNFECRLMTDKLSKVEKSSAQRGFLEVYRLNSNRAPYSNGSVKVKTIEVETPKLLERNVPFSKFDEVIAERYESGKIGLDYSNEWENDFTRLLDDGVKLGAWPRRECECLLSKELLAFDFAKEGDYGYVAFKFDNIECGKFSIIASALSNCDLWLVYDDILIDGKVKFNREQIIHGLKWSLEKGEYKLYSQEVYSAKYITLIYKGKLDIKSVSVIRVENPAEIKAFECDDKDLKLIYDAAARSFKHNAYDIPTDCPSRERAGWLCDSYFSSIAEKFFTGKCPVEKNFLENYEYYENEMFDSDGVLPMCYPSAPSNKDDYIPNWILWFILELRDYKRRTGDGEFIDGFADRVKNVVEFFKGYENEYGLLENLGGWVFIEWSKANDYSDGVNFPSNMLYAEALYAAGELLGDEELKEKSKKIKKTIYEIAYDGELFRDHAVREDGKLTVADAATETCQVYAAFFDVVGKDDEKFYSAFFNRFEGKNLCPPNVFIGYVMRLAVLLREKRDDLLVDDCKKMFLPMAKRTGTIWELFSENASCNHGFGSIIGYFIYKAYGRLSLEEESNV